MVDFPIEIGSEWTPVAASQAVEGMAIVPAGTGFYYTITPDDERPSGDYSGVDWHSGLSRFEIPFPGNSILWLATRQMPLRTILTRPTGDASEAIEIAGAADLKADAAVATANAAAGQISAAIIPNSAAVLWPEGMTLPSGWVQVGSITGFLIVTKSSATPAPSMLTAPTATPSTVTVGDNVTLTLGTWSNGTPAGVLMQGATDRTGEITDGVWSPGVAGAFTWTVTATGPGGSTAAPVVNGTVEAPVVVDNTQAAGHISETYTGTPTAITGITNEGVGDWDLVVTGTGAEIQRSGRGFEFADGKFTQAAGLTTTGLGGVFVVVRGILDSYGSGLQSLIEVNPTGALLQLRNNNGSMQAVYNTGTSVTISLGSVTYGQEFVIGIEVDNDAGYVRVSNLAGELVQSTPAGTPLINYATVRSGQRVIGAISEWSIFTKPVGGEYAFEFEDVLADFTAG